MVVFNPSKREIGAKIVYYGPALCGKTTNLQYIHKKLNPNQRGELVSLATKDDRTLFFDFLPLELGKVKGFNTRFHLYTVPGQVYYVSTRRAVLTGVDGIIFVADSQDEKMAENIESLEDLEKNLLFYGKKLDEIPTVMQYNKCDLKNLASIEELNKTLNKRHLPFLKASAPTGQGVMESLTMVCKVVLQNLEDGTKKTKPVQKEASQVPVIQTPPAVRPAQPKPAAVVPDSTAEPLIELESEEEVLDIDRLRAERRATIDKLLKPEAGTPAPPPSKGTPEVDLEEFEDLDEIKDEVVAEEIAEIGPPEDGLADGENEALELSGFEAPADREGEKLLETDLEIPEEPLEFDDSEVAVSASSEEESFSEGTEREEIELEAEEQLQFEEPEESEISGEELAPELALEPPEPTRPAEEVVSDASGAQELPAIEIVSCDEPEKLSATSLRVPLTIKLKDINKEARITLRVQIEDLLIK